MRQNQTISELIRSMKEGKKINIISIITQDKNIAEQYQAVTGELLTDELREFREPFADILVQVIKDKIELQAEILAAETDGFDWEFVFSLVFFTKNNPEMHELVDYFNSHYSYKIDNLISQVCKTKLQRRVFTALIAGFRSEERELQDVAVIQQLNEAISSNNEAQLSDLMIYVLCSFSADQIRTVLQSVELEEKCVGECGYFFRNLILWSQNQLIPKLLDEAMLCDESLKIKRIGMILLSMQGQFNFEEQIGEANFQEEQKTFVYEVMYRLWK